MAISIKGGDIVSINGPFPCGSHPDRTIFNLCLKEELEEWEFVVADSGYRGDHAMTPTGLNNLTDRMCAVGRARHENVNHRFKEFNCLKNCYRHDRNEHYNFFAPVVLLVQLCMEREGAMFNFDYIENL